jgi:hypothetical protein
VRLARRHDATALWQASGLNLNPPSPPPPPPNKPSSGVYIQSAGSSPKIVQANILAGNNGILQVIDGMLLPVKLSEAAALGR